MRRWRLSRPAQSGRVSRRNCLGLDFSVGDQITTTDQHHPELVVETDRVLPDDLAVGQAREGDPRRANLLDAPCHRGVIWVRELTYPDRCQLVREGLGHTGRAVLLEGGTKLGQPI